MSAMPHAAVSAFDRLRALAGGTTPRDTVKGQWFRVRLTADPAVGETLNVGVGFVEPGGRVSTKLLEDFRRLDCLYGDRLDMEQVQFLLRVVRATCDQVAPLVSPSPQIQFSAPQYAAGPSVESILDDLYGDTVTLDYPSPVPVDAAPVTEQLDTAAARRLVFDAMQRRNPFSRSLIAANPDWAVADGERTRLLDMPLRAPLRFGNVLSCWYRSRSSLELQLLRSTLDMDTALRLHPNETGALFILRPPPLQRGYTEVHHQQIDNAIDAIGWRLRVQRARMEVEDVPDALAARVLDWADIAA